MTRIRFQAACCGRAVVAKTGLAGKILQCPSCGKDIQVPTSDGEPNSAPHSVGLFETGSPPTAPSPGRSLVESEYTLASDEMLPGTVQAQPVATKEAAMFQPRQAVVSDKNLGKQVFEGEYRFFSGTMITSLCVATFLCLIGVGTYAAVIELLILWTITLGLSAVAIILFAILGCFLLLFREKLTLNRDSSGAASLITEISVFGVSISTWIRPLHEYTEVIVRRDRESMREGSTRNIISLAGPGVEDLQLGKAEVEFEIRETLEKIEEVTGLTCSARSAGIDAARCL